jgi:hypothetical protein
MRPLQCQPILNQPANSNYTSAAIDARQLVCFSLQAYAGAGSCAGTFQVQVSNTPCLQRFVDYGNSANPVIWTNLGTPLTFSQSSTASSQLITKTDLSYVAVRVVFTDSSGGTNTSNITANLEALGL